MRDSMLMYRSFIDAARKITNKAERLKLYEAIFDLGLDEENTDLDGVSGALFELIRPVILANNKRFANGKKPKQTRSKTEANEKQNGSETLANIRRKDIGGRIKEEGEEKNKKENSFTPPTPAEVTSYCKQRQSKVDPQRFVDYYTRQGWMLANGMPMADWKAAVRSWEKDEHKRPEEYHEIEPVYEPTPGEEPSEEEVTAFRNRWQRS